MAWAEVAPRIVADDVVRELWLTNCHLPKDRVAWTSDLTSLSRLSHLILDRTPVTPEDLTRLGGHAMLTHLRIRNYADFSDSCAIRLGQMERLREIAVEECSSLTIEGMAGLTALGNLDALELGSIRTLQAGEIGRVLGKCKLNSLTLHGLLLLSHDDWKSLASHKSLTSLHIVGAAPTDDDIILLKDLSLSHLSLANINLASDNALGEVIRSLPLLSLKLTVGKQVTGVFLADFGKARQLRNLSLSAPYGDKAMDTSVLRHLTSLKNVQLSGARICTDQSLTALLGIKGIECIRILDGGTLSKESILNLKSASSLMEIEIYWMNQFTVWQLDEIRTELKKAFGERPVVVVLRKEG
ncbi:MAG: hypothetical protein BroJett021_52910 [Chloroflexota bacterium]|nr:MAG: hypothetical protein BroJett021_52910 [Chloroflexota bacterium]